MLPCIASLPWPGRESHATPGCASPAVGLMEMSACSWNTHFDVMNCSGVHTLPKCQITACIPQCDIWTPRYWEEGWNISGTLVSIAQNVSPLIQVIISKLMVEIPQHLTSSYIQLLNNNNTQIYTYIMTATKKETHPVDHNKYTTTWTDILHRRDHYLYLVWKALTNKMNSLLIITIGSTD